MNRVLLISCENDRQGFFSKILSSDCTFFLASQKEKVVELIDFVDLIIFDFLSFGANAHAFARLLGNRSSHLKVLLSMNEPGSYHHELGEMLSIGFGPVLYFSSPSELVRRQVALALESQGLKKELEMTRSFQKAKEEGDREHVSQKTVFENAFFKGVYRDREALKNFAKILSTHHDLEKLLNYFLLVLVDMLGVRRGAVLLKDDMGNFKVRGAVGLPLEMIRDPWVWSEKGIRYLEEGRVLNRDSGHFRNWVEENRKILEDLDVLKAHLVVPMLENGRVMGVFSLGEKVSGSSFTEDEISLMMALASQLAMAVSASFLHEELIYQMNYIESMVQHAASGIITVDHRGFLTHINKAAEDFLNEKASRLVGKDYSILPGAIRQPIQETLEKGRSYQRHEVRLNAQKCLGLSTSRLISKSGALLGTVMMFTDLSVIKDQEKQLRSQERLQFISKMAQATSHELKNCLVSIQTFSQLLPEKYVDESFRKDFGQVVTGEVERLKTLVDNFVVFAHPSDLKWRPEDVREVIEESLSSLKEVDWTGIRVERAFQHQINVLLMDRLQMVKALSNIVKNALQAMGRRGGTLTVLTKMADPASLGETKMKDEALLIQIEDTGEGIADEHLPEIFEPFFSTKIRGIGLGLTIAKRIIEDHGGCVRVTSLKGKGTQVSVAIPVRLTLEMPPEGKGPSGSQIIRDRANSKLEVI
ncbi:MAG: GAF domain-containing protein [Chlamydiae bacterium]|nr:GAF domain-containing protein [Chlamydiota bacterium]MBI3266503.1 GAF domain-containing protein [Chlamydiota bacterium]